ncbi:MAG: CobW family GTP-binding protein [Atopobiaceae bacterium]
MGHKIKLYVLTGFLGSGKTTFLMHVLTQLGGKRVGVIQNEFGKLSIDGDILRHDNVEMKELTSGSIFCSCLKLNFVQALAEMSDHDLDCLFVESSGLADPSNLQEILDAVDVLRPNKPYELAGTICLVDAVGFMHDVVELETVERQLIHCNIALINKCDLVDRARIEEITQRIHTLNRHCLVVETVDGVLDPAYLEQDLTHYEWAPTEETTNSVDTKPKTFSIEFDDVPRERMDAFLTALIPHCYRIKGFGKIDGAWQQIDMAAGKIDYKPCADAGKSRLIFISKVGIKLIRDIKQQWDAHVGLPITLHN